MNAGPRVSDTFVEPPRTDIVAKSAANQRNIFAVTALTTGAALTVAWIGLLSWLLVYAVRVSLG